jgi:hypothetical protein
VAVGVAIEMRVSLGCMGHQPEEGRFKKMMLPWRESHLRDICSKSKLPLAHPQKIYTHRNNPSNMSKETSKYP